MAGANGRHVFATSPNSSEDEVVSSHATPATKISPFSPNSTRDSLKLSGTGIVRSKVPPAFILTQIQPSYGQDCPVSSGGANASQDPFVSGPSLTADTRSSTDTSKLSPTASTFTPQSVLQSSCSSSGSFFDPSGGSTLSPRTFNKGLSKLPFLACRPRLYDGIADADADGTSLLPDAGDPSSGPRANLSFGGHATHGCAFRIGSFSTADGTSRALMINHVYESPGCTIEGFFSATTFPSVKDVVLADLALTSSVYVHFGNIRDARRAFNLLEGSRLGWKVTHMDPRCFALKAQSGRLNVSQVSRYEAHVLVTANYKCFQSVNSDRIGNLVYEVLALQGELLAMEEHSITPTEVVFLAEFCSVDAIDPALASVTGKKIETSTLSIRRYQPDVAAESILPPKRRGPLIIGQEDGGIDTAFQNMSFRDSPTCAQAPQSSTSSRSPFLASTSSMRSFTSRKGFGGQHTPSPLDHQFNAFAGNNGLPSPFWSPPYGLGSGSGAHQSIWSPIAPGAIGQEREALSPPVRDHFFPYPRNGFAMQHQRSPFKAGRRQNDHSTGAHNIVDVNRIRLGSDVRTTIMLRNIPNKMTSDILKQILDETSFGKYDFTYLRIDFANNCNVGYAFINFEDPYHIINFVNARAGRRWNCYQSDKVAEISYATIQGRDCLIQKFRNSSVMLEQPSSRPKIWSTGPGPMTGQEEPFPGPDNPSKMRRSVENAEHVGLFAPRAGQNFRDEQRRRRSQYDRGTRLAEIEDTFDSGLQYRGSLNDTHTRTPSLGHAQPQLHSLYPLRFPGPIF